MLLNLLAVANQQHNFSWGFLALILCPECPDSAQADGKRGAALADDKAGWGVKN